MTALKICSFIECVTFIIISYLQRINNYKLNNFIIILTKTNHFPFAL